MRSSNINFSFKDTFNEEKGEKNRYWLKQWEEIVMGWREREENIAFLKGRIWPAIWMRRSEQYEYLKKEQAKVRLLSRKKHNNIRELQEN